MENFSVELPKLERLETFLTQIDNPSQSIERSPSVQSMSRTPRTERNRTKNKSEDLPRFDSPLPKQTDSFEKKPIAASPRKVPMKTTNSYFTEARRWAERTHDLTYTTLLFASEDAAKQIPMRRTAPTLRKLPELDSRLLTKLMQNRSPQEVRKL